MNILFLADLHITKKRLPLIENLFGKINNICKERKVDLIIFGGDLWDSMVSNSSKSGFTNVLDLFKNLKNTGVQIRVIYGTPSHEPDGSLDFLRTLDISVFDTATMLQEGDTKILYLPEPRRSRFLKETSKLTDNNIRNYLNDNCNKEPNIIVYHGEISGAKMDNGVAIENDTSLSLDNIKKSKASLVLAGHIHTPQEVFNNCFYVGSPIPCNFGETHKGSMIFFTVEGNKISNLERIYTGAPEKLTLEFDNSDLSSLYNSDFSNKDLKISVTLSNSEALTFNSKKEAALIKEKTGALSVKILSHVLKHTPVRSDKINKVKSLSEKFELYCQLTNTPLNDPTREMMKQIEENLSINYTFPSKSFELISLHLRGAKGIKKEEVFVDFSNYEDGLVALIGANGAGKTTLLEMASPFPCLLTRGGALRNHFYLKDSFKKVIFRDDDGTYYKFTILIDAHIENGSVKYYVATSKDNILWHVVNSCTGNLAEYQDYVTKMFGDVAMYLRTAFFTKGNTKGVPDIASATKSQRMDLFSQLLGTENISLVHSLVSAKLKEMKNDISNINEVKAEIENTTLTLSSASEKLRAVKVHYDNIDTDLKEAKNKLKNLEAKQKELLKDLDVDTPVEKLAARYEQEIEEGQEILDVLLKHKERNDFAKYNLTRIEEYKNSVKEMEEIKNSYNDNKSLISMMEETSEKYRLKLSYLELELKNSQAKLNNLSESLEAKKQDLKKVIEESEICPYCGAKLNVSQKKIMVSKQTNIMDEIQQMEDIKKSLSQELRAQKKEFSKIETAYKTSIEKLEAKKETFKNDEIHYNMLAHKLDVNSDLKDYVDYVIVSYIDNDIERVSKDLKYKRDMLIMINAEDCRTFNADISETKENITYLEDLRTDVAKDLGERTATVKFNSEKLESLKESFESKIQISKEYDSLSVIDKAFSNSGILALELEASAPEIADITNKILKESYGDKFSISFSTLRRGRTKVVDDFSIEVTNSETGWTTPIELLSEGEKIWVIQSLYYAFSLVRMRKTGFSFKVRFVDESDGALDSEMRLKYVNMIQSAHNAGNARLTVMITHSQEIKDIVTQVINL